MLGKLQRRYDIYKTYSKVTKLWEEFSTLYKIRSHRYPDALNSFLNNFNSAYSIFILNVEQKESSSTGDSPESSMHSVSAEMRNIADGATVSNLDLDKVFGDLSKVLLGLFEFAEIESGMIANMPQDSVEQNAKVKTEDLIMRCIASIELILRDDKYRVKMKESKEFMKRLLLLLDNVSSFEPRKSILQIICHLSSAENRSEISNSDTLKKILELLSLGDSELTKEILKTLRHFMETPQNENLQDIQSSAHHSDAFDQSLAPQIPLSLSIPDDKEKEEIQKTPLVSLSGVMAQLGKHALNEIMSPPAKGKASTPTFFSKSGSTTPKQSGGNTPKVSGNTTPKLFMRNNQTGQSNNENSVTQEENPVNLSAKLAANVQLVSDRKNESSFLAPQFPLPRSVVSKAEDAFSIGIWRKPMLMDIEKSQDDQIKVEDSFKESMRIHGVLRHLTESIGSADIEVQLELIDTIGKLLLKNHNNQAEFLKIGGFDLITALFSQVELVEENREIYFSRLFPLLINICFDGSTGLIGNMNCLSWMIGLLSCDLDPLVHMKLLCALQDIINANPMNTLHLRKENGINAIFSFFEKVSRRLYETEKHSELDDSFGFLRQLSLQSAALLKHIAAVLTYVDTSVVHLLSHVFLTEDWALNSIIVGSISQLIRHFQSFGQELELSSELISKLMGLVKNLSEETAESVSTGMKEELYIETLECLAQALLYCKDAEEKLEFFIDSDGLLLLLECLKKELSYNITFLILYISTLLIKLDSDNRKMSLFPSLIEALGLHFLSKTTRVLIMGALVKLFRSRLPSNQFSESHFLDDFRIANGFYGLQCLVKESDHDLCNSAFILLAQAIVDFLPNKNFIGEKIGYLELAQGFLASSKALKFDVFFFDVVFELTTNGSFLNSNFMNASVLNMFEIPKALEERVLRLEAESYSIPSLAIASDRFRKGFQRGASGLILPSSNSQNTSLRSPSPVPVLRHVASEPNLVNSVESSESTAQVTNRFPFPKARTITVKPPTASESEQNESSDSIHNSASLEFEDGGRNAIRHEDLSSQTKFLSTDAALMVVLLLPSAHQDIQRSCISRLSKLFSSNPGNMRIFCEMHIFSFLLRMLPGFPDSLHNSYFQLAASLGAYDITHQELKLLFDLASLEYNPRDNMSRLRFDELKMQIFFVIGRLAEKVSPNVFFNLSGVGFPLESLQSPPISRFPIANKGYCLLFWFCPNKFLGQRISLLSFGDQDGEFSLSVHLVQSERSGRHLRHLSLTLCNSENSEPSVSMDENSKWHLFAVSHNKQYFNVFLDGVLIFQILNPVYPSQISRARPLIARFGTNEFNSLIRASPFCGQISGISVFDGFLDAKFIQSIWHEGATFSGSLKSIGIDLKKIVNLDPSDPSKKKVDRVGALLVSPKPIGRSSDDKMEFILSHSPASSSYLKPEVLGVIPTYFESRSSFLSDNDFALGSSDTTSGFSYFEVNQNIDSISSCDVHFTRSISEEIGKIGGVFLCLNFLNKGNTQQVNSIRILGLLLENSDENVKLFEISKGFEMICFLLQSLPSSELSMETFDVLMELMCSTISSRPSITRKRLIKRPFVLIIILDLLRICDLGVRLNIISALCDLISEQSTNREVWNQQCGILGGVDLLRISPESIASVLLIIDGILKDCEAEEIEKLFNYLVIVENEFLSEKALIFDLFRKCLYRRHALLHHLLKVDGFLYLFSLMSSVNESTVLNAIKLTGMCINEGPKGKAQFFKYHGFDVMIKVLSSLELNVSICSCLLKLLLGEFSLKIENSTSPSDDHKDSKEAPLISIVESLKVPFALLSSFSELSLHILFFDNIENLLESAHNIELLLQSDWLQWCQNYYENFEKYINPSIDPKSRSRVLSKFFLLIQKTILYDMSHYKAARLSKLKELAEAEDFQIQVIGSILEYLEIHPFVEDTVASIFLRNLVSLFEHVEEIVGLTPEICVRIINSINLMASQNNDIIRTQMKDNGIFEIRDNLVLHFIRDSPPPYEGLYESFSNLSLETVAAHPKFRNSQGALYILKIFLETTDFSLKVLLAEILREQLGDYEENRKDLIRVIFDLETLILLFRDIDADDFQAININQANCFSSANEVSLSFDPSAFNFDSDDYSDSDFVSWYFMPEQEERRKAVMSRLESAILLTESKLKKQREAVVLKKQKRLKLRLEKLEKSKQSLDRAVSEILDKVNLKVSRSALDYASAQQVNVEARLKRLQTGEEEWARRYVGAVEPKMKWIEIPPESCNDNSDVYECVLCKKRCSNLWEIVCHSSLDH